MPISHRHKCIFVHIPKTGGTSVERALGIFADWRQENRALMFGRIASDAIRTRGFLSRFLQHLTLPQIRELAPAEAIRGYVSFSVVRNPWDRMVSTYASPDSHLVDTARRAGIEITGLDFADFLQAVGRLEHIHLQAQNAFICDTHGRLLVDRVLRFESLSSEFSRLCRDLSFQGTLGYHNRSNRKPYRCYYDDRSRRIVAATYRRDIELFGYRF
jgi:hypothetical protein